jgi:hypothetical protein
VRPDPGTARLATPSGTATVLRRLRRAMVAACVLVAALCPLTLAGAHATTGVIRHRAEPAVFVAEAAYESLLDAHRVAVGGIADRSAQFGDPGGRYDDDVAAVGQSLERLAADNVAGPGAAARIRLAQSMVVDYNAAVARADADVADGVGDGPAAVDLSEAAGLLTPLEATLRGLRGDEAAALAARRSSFWLSGPAVLVWALPVLLTLLLFAWTHLLIRRRFRRDWTVLLTLGALALLATAVLCGVSQRSYVTRVHGALDGPYATTLARAERTDAVLAGAGESGLRTVVARVCPGAGHCGTHLPRGTAPPAGVDALTGTLRQQRTTAQAALDHRLTGAEPGYPVRPVGTALLALLAAGLAAYGVRPRIAEYEFGA